MSTLISKIRGHVSPAFTGALYYLLLLAGKTVECGRHKG